MCDWRPGCRGLCVEQLQHCCEVLRADRVSVGQQRDAGRSGGVDDVVLVPSTTGELTHPRARGGGDVVHGLSAGQQHCVEVTAEPAGGLHPPPLLEKRRRPAQQPPVAIECGVDLRAGQHPVRIRVRTHPGGVGALVGIVPDADDRFEPPPHHRAGLARGPYRHDSVGERIAPSCWASLMGCIRGSGPTPPGRGWCRTAGRWCCSTSSARPGWTRRCRRG